ncbi:MAG: TonB-dependent receptor [Bacteroidales bacterium]|nr:MAG: TonB-dependent receptor [Bacteroidales bacterium]
MCRGSFKSFVLVVLLLINFCFRIVSQGIDSLYLSAKYINTPLTELLSELEEQYPVSFYYKNEWFIYDTVNLSFSNTPLPEALDKLVKGTPYLYQIIQDNMIVFMLKEEVAIMMGQMVDLSLDMKDISIVVIGDPDDAGKFKKVTLTGTISDGKTGESLFGATIHIENTTNAVISNLNGEYSLEIYPGIYTLVVTSIGFEKALYKVKIISNGNLDIELFEKSIKIDEVAIYSQRVHDNIRGNQMSLVEMDAKNIKKLPAIVGEKDILKSLTLMPGVKSIGEFGSGINVRGGGEDQNLYLLEGAPVFNTSHVFGLLSVINPDAVNNVTLYKGHIPAGYGERISSVMEIELRNNNLDKMHARGGIGLYNSRLMLEGPVYKDILTFNVGGRTSYSNWLLGELPDYYLQKSSASFYDVNGLLKLDLKKHQITLFGYNSYNKFRYTDELNYEYENILGSLKWGQAISSSLRSSLNVSFSQYNVKKDNIKTAYEENRLSSQINYISGKYNISFMGFTNHNIDLGLQSIYYKTQPGEIIPLNDSSLVNPELLMNEQAYEGSIYINDLYEINNNISVNAGIRYSGYFFTGPLKIPQYRADASYSEISVIDSVYYNNGEIIKSYFNIEPRLSLKVQLNDNNSVKLSYNRNSQYISLISYTSIPTPDDVWKLSGAYIKPLIANQFAIGYYRNFLGKSIETSVELYYKKLNNLVEYKNNASLEMRQHLETELINASGRNYGVEFLLKKKTGKLDGWISYTFSRTFKKTSSLYNDEIINNNEFYPSSYDKPHDLTVLFNYNINRRWRIMWNFTFSSGRPVTLPEYKYTIGAEQIIYYSDRNKYRLPPYHRLDLSVSLDESLRIKKKWKGSWTFSILNVYARKNAYSVFYKKAKPDKDSDYQRFNLYKLYIIGRPLPTITYNFIF